MIDISRNEQQVLLMLAMRSRANHEEIKAAIDLPMPGVISSLSTLMMDHLVEFDDVPSDDAPYGLDRRFWITDRGLDVLSGREPRRGRRRNPMVQLPIDRLFA